MPIFTVGLALVTRCKCWTGRVHRCVDGVKMICYCIAGGQKLAPAAAMC